MITLLLVSILPFLTFIQTNVNELYSSNTFLELTIYFVVTFGILQLTSFLLSKLNWIKEKKAISLTSILFLIFINYGNYKAVLLKISPDIFNLGAHFPFFILLNLLVPLWAIKKFNEEKLSSLLHFVLAVMCGSSIVFTLPSIFVDKNPKVIKEQFDPYSVRLEQTPNIYFFILDGYARFDNLSDQLKINETLLQETFQDLNFQVASKSYANFSTSFLSISHTMNMSYIVDPKEPIIKDRGLFYAKIRGKNPFVRILKKHRYHYAHFQNGYWAGSFCEGYETECIYHQTPNRISLSEVQHNLVALTPLLPVIRRINRSSSDHLKKPKISQIGSLHRWISSNKRADKTFLFAHVMAPHPPTEYKKDCSYLSLQEFNLTSWSVGQQEIEIKCINKEFSALLQTIQKKDPNGIIIVQSDHGSETRGQMKKSTLAEWDELDIKERYGILNAVKTKKHCDKAYPTEITPINSLRFILNCLSKQKVQFVEDLHFWTDTNNSKENRLEPLEIHL